MNGNGGNSTSGSIPGNVADGGGIGASLIADYENSIDAANDAPHAAAVALAEVLNGVITGEGPTARGRVHFSRTLDCEDAILCERILLAAGRDGAAVSRAEADMLFDIDAAATERTDQGRFDDLFSKAVAHYVLAAAGRDVPPRDIALAAETPLTTWAFVQPNASMIDTEIQTWIVAQMNNRKRLSEALATVAAMLGGAAFSPVAQSVTGFWDLGI
jgi:hypothetical protein